MDNEKMMQQAGMKKLFLNLCIPAVMIMLVIVIYNMADVFFIGKTGDINQVAAVSLAGPVFSVFQGIGTLLGGGGAIAVSMALGKKQEQRVKQISSFCSFAAIALGVLTAVLVNIFAHPIASLLGAGGDITAHTVIYIRVLALGAPAVLFANIFANIIRADGSAKESMIANMTGTALNIILDPIFILVLKIGVSGAAIATVLGNIASCLYLLWYMNRKQKKFSLHISDVTFRGKLPLEIISLGIPLALSTVLMSFSSMFSNRLMAGYGEVVIAANGVASKTGMLLAMVVMGICMGIQPAISYCYGAGELKRVRKILKSTAIVSIAVGTILTVICLVFRNEIIAFFISDQALAVYGEKMVIACLVSGPVYGLYQLSTTFLQGTGKVSYATVVSVLRQGLIFVPVLVTMNFFLGLNGLIYSAAVSDMISILIGCGLSLHWFRQINEVKIKSSDVNLLKI